jgi:hypothetical protein
VVSDIHLGKGPLINQIAHAIVDDIDEILCFVSFTRDEEMGCPIDYNVKSFSHIFILFKII